MILGQTLKTRNRAPQMVLLPPDQRVYVAKVGISCGSRRLPVTPAVVRTPGDSEGFDLRGTESEKWGATSWKHPDCFAGA